MFTIIIVVFTTVMLIITKSSINKAYNDGVITGRMQVLYENEIRDNKELATLRQENAHLDSEYEQRFNKQGQSIE